MSPARRFNEPASTLAESVALDEFLAGVEPLAIADRYQLVEQASVLLEELYVHLPLKRAMHAIDPVQRLRLLKRRLESLSELQFHAELAAIFRSLRDLHTVYQLPVPYRGHVATLGFLVERYHDPDDGVALPGHQDRSRVSSTRASRAAPSSSPGTASRSSGRSSSTPSGRPARTLDARLARGLEALTLRSASERPTAGRTLGPARLPEPSRPPRRDPDPVAGDGRRDAPGRAQDPVSHDQRGARHRRRQRGNATGEALALRAQASRACRRPRSSRSVVAREAFRIGGLSWPLADLLVQRLRGATLR